ncbi:hypothetical protein MYX07_00790 [Patescibacteria group bacterium AH-259-L07]|nr:hypothetical protein [Patescibacteria group bacterium AH-259-L07]
MANIKFEVEKPFFENRKFGVCIDRIDYGNEKLDDKFIYIDNPFCHFELPKLGVTNIEMSNKNTEAMEWLRLYAYSLKGRYEQNWEEQPEELHLIRAGNLPTIEDLQAKDFRQ